MENEEKYLKDLKELKPLPLESAGSRQSAVRSQKSVGSPKSAIGSQERESREMETKAAVIIKDNQSGIIEMKEVIVVESLKNSKTLWGFGIAAVIFILQQVLLVLNIASPDNLLVKAVIEVIIAIAGFCGVYGIRDALRKMSI